MSKSTPPTPSTPFASSSSIASNLAPFSTTSTSRLQALYSDFSRQKQSNPASYHANVEWWRKALESLVISGSQDIDFSVSTLEDSTPPKSDRLILHAGKPLVERVKIPKVGKPLSLGAVLSDLRSSKIALPLSEFLNANASIYDPGWLPGRIASFVVGKPLWWALEHMGIVGEEGILGSFSSSPASGRNSQSTSWHGDYVLVSLVERAADEVEDMLAKKMASKTDALFTKESFRDAFGAAAGGDDVLREADATVLVKYLERDRGVVVVDKEIIKFVESAASAEERTITAVDRGILELKTAIRNLDAQIESLQSKVDECTKKATLALQQKRKPAALGYIRSRKLLEGVLEKRLGSLSTLEATFISVETAAGDIEIMKSYESSTTTLRNILSHPSLERGKIDETMEALAEANTNAKEVDDIIRIGGDVALGIDDAVDDDELEEEWKAMVKEIEVDNMAKTLAQGGRIPEHESSKDEAVTEGSAGVLVAT
ncbi:Snf7-domain-containing protein [Crepidotus variabilis]|uniref:Snf7-domain-containing protein n=1 Tax=Crepidotus variabilis TaxID=179855 RepID=A0A9P6ECP0_9AGAR|nr:Snf7-domain-containing protein [Crepidotus variabilis]